MKIALVVAHQDDEVLWHLPDPGAHVFCCSTPFDDTPREGQFVESCYRLGVTFTVLPQRAGPFVNSPVELKPGIVLTGYDMIVTHNEKGEYGHPQHIQIHNWVKNHYKGKIVTFGHGLKYAWTRTLTDAQLDRKIAALQCYRSPVPQCDGEITWKRLVRTFYGDKLENLRYERFVL